MINRWQKRWLLAGCLMVTLLLVLACNGGGGSGSSSGSSSNPPPAAQPVLQPDLVITDIILKNTDSVNRQIIVNTVVRNNGAAARDGFLVGCNFRCGDGVTYFSGMTLPNGLGAGQEVTLGDDAWLSLSSCPFAGNRTFSCMVDAEERVDEADESNNVREEVLMTGM